MNDESRNTLSKWLNEMPEWAKVAYANCPLCNRVIHQCALSHNTTEEMLWTLAGALYDDRNLFHKAVLDIHRKSKIPVLVVIPKNDTEDKP